MKYWLIKTEPNTYSWDDLKSLPNQTDHWEGVRNYKARNLMRSMKKGDKAFFYHSVVQPMSIMGIVEVVREAYPDHTQFDPKSKYYDPKSPKDNPRWFMVDVQYRSDFDPPITRDELKEISGLEKMVLLKKGTRLSVQPVTAEEWKIITSLRK